jgi:branched-chain amino acid transport system substrate-binding protein
MAIKKRSFGTLALVLAVASSVALAGCTATSSGGSPQGVKGKVGTLGTPNAAKGSPVVFGVLNLQSGPVTFPEVLTAEQAAVSYVNAYKGGIGGHPIKLVSCATDGSPATSAQCANQILDQHPVAILGAADTGAPGAIPVWNRAGLAYLGGVPFTPVEQNNKDGVIFRASPPLTTRRRRSMQLRPWAPSPPR